MTITATPEPGASPPRVRLDLDGLSGLSSVAVTRADADGRTRAVRASPVRLTSGRGVAYDREVPFGDVVQWAVVEDQASVSALVSLDVDDPWLVHPFRSDASVRLLDLDGRGPLLSADSTREWNRPSSRVLMRPLGGRLPIHVGVGGRGGGGSTLRFTTEGGLAADVVLSLVDDDVPLLLSVPPAMTSARLRSVWMSVGDVTQTSEGDGDDPDELVDWELPFEVVDAPYGAAQNEWACADVTATYETCADVTRRYATCVDLTTDTRRVVVA